MEDNRNGNAYMTQDQIQLFNNMALTEKWIFEYEKQKEDDYDWDDETDIKYQVRSAKQQAYEKVRKLMHLEDEYERFKLICLDSQMDYMEKCGKYDDYTIEIYTDKYEVDDYSSLSFGLHWKIENNIFKNGWSFSELYGKCSKKDVDFKHETCRKLFDMLQAQKRRRLELASYTTLEEAKKYIEDPMEYHCKECGATFYTSYHSKYSTPIKCPVCETEGNFWFD